MTEQEAVTRVWETCGCGATFQIEIAGDDASFDADYAARAFREAHAQCRQRTSTVPGRTRDTKRDTGAQVGRDA